MKKRERRTGGAAAQAREEDTTPSAPLSSLLLLSSPEVCHHLFSSPLVQEIIRGIPNHLKIVDLSADFRLRDISEYEEWYGQPHRALELQKEAIYGLTEILREEIRNARLVANPGCYPTSIQIPLVPLIKNYNKELGDGKRVTAQQKHAIEDLNERLSASMQSYAEAYAIISSQKVNIAELKEQLDDKQTQRKEREKATTDLKAAVFRAQSEAQEELRRHTDAALRRERELHETINKLQESERERCLLVETLRSKLEDTRQKMVVCDNKVRQLETELHEEKLTTANQTKKIEELEEETRRLSKELESEKQAA
ncbi:probable N-acetyl-gamma-glutamyl-phosphate reductase, chloroplastic [Arachis ipaensis]|uniref:probable N-acetyl-gamma-glutamyl-phosphate reductase, chloroplastic n=1 Tax=Arachis ipaensis TaxID=130454 RepID=UPI000A2B61E7|nr:probable N-acetyl-gamma-glutamyl-phosphate reductase, chloroplastic [Arachis ipaensis]